MGPRSVAVEKPNLLVDGVMTVELTNNRRFTYRIREVKKGSLTGRRIVELLIGPDNTSSYKGFGFVDCDGRISVWQKYRTESYLKHAGLLMDKHRDMVTAWHQAGKCKRCQRLLTDPESIRRGLGSTCAGLWGPNDPGRLF